MRTVIVRWTGAYSYEQVINSNKSKGFYLLIGKRKYEREEGILYCGITEGKFCNRISHRHHKLSYIRRNTLSIWIGEVFYPTTFDRYLLELGEHCFVSFWQPPLNDRKTIYYPQDSICFISHWYRKNGQPFLRRPSIVKNLPDTLWWDKRLWRTGKLKIWEPL